MSMPCGFGDWSDDDLLRALKVRGRSAGGGGLLEAILRRYELRIARWCLRALEDPETAASCAQDVLVRMARGLAGFRGDCRFSTWVYALARRVCASEIARRARRVERGATIEAPLRVADPSADPRRRAEACERALLFHAIVERHLSPVEWEALRRHHVDGVTMAEVTSELGLENPSGARAILARARRKLRLGLSLARLTEIGFHVSSLGARPRSPSRGEPPHAR